MKEVQYFDGNIVMIKPVIDSGRDAIEELQREIESMHTFLDKMNVSRYGGSGANGQKTLGERYQELVDRNSQWGEIK